ncbi:hypothetical protein ABPG72_000193 [Tetrahymena utriculariae]
MSEKNIQQSLQNKLKNFCFQPKPFKEVFNQYFTKEVKDKVQSIIENPNSLLPLQEQSNYYSQDLKDNQTDLEYGNNELENKPTDQKQANNIKQLSSLRVPQLQTGFICFLKGLFYETGFLNNYEPNFSKALYSYQEGFKIQRDSLCSLKMAEIYSNKNLAQKFGFKCNQEVAYGYLTIANTYLDVQYDNNLFNFSKDVEQIAQKFSDWHQFAIDNINNNQKIIFQSFTEKEISEEIEQIKVFLNFKYSTQQDSQQCYSAMLNYLGGRDKKADSLLLIIKILSNQTHNENKLVKNLIDKAKKFSLQIIHQVLQYILSESILFSALERDHDVFNCLRTTFIEMFNLLKIISYDTHLLVPYSTFESNNQNGYHPIHSKINQISEILFTKKHTFKNLLHNTLIIRLRTEVLQKGIGIKQSVQDAIKTLDEEKELKKGQQCLFAFYHYKKAKLLQKLNASENSLEIQKNFELSLQYFQERMQSPDLTIQVLSSYYLGRIYSSSQAEGNQAHQQFKQTIDYFKQNDKKFNQVKTFQFEILEIKSEKQLNNLDLSKIVETRISHQSQKIFNFDDGVTLQLKVELVSKQSNFIFYDDSVFDILQFVAKREIGSTSIAKINYNLLDEKENIILQKQNNFAYPSTFSSKIKERVIIKQIPFNKNNYFDKIFHHLAKIQRLINDEGLLQQKGFCIKQISDIAFELWIVYPQLDYNLYAIIKQNLLIREKQKILFAQQVSQTIKNLHENNSYHGNLKPSNVLMDNAHKAYLSDWEFSSKMYHKDKVSQSMILKSKSEQAQISPNIEDDDSIDKNPLYSFGYIAPEIFQNPQKAKFQGAAADLFSLGMIFYFLFTGQDPSFCGLVQEQQLYNNNDLKISRERIKNDKLRELIESMVKFDPQKRCSIQKTCEELNHLLEDDKCSQHDILVDAHP